MGDRFLDDANIKPRGNSKIQSTLARARQLQQKVTQQINSLPSEEVSKLLIESNNQEIINNTVQKLELPEQKPKRKRVIKKELKNVEPAKNNILDSLDDNTKISHALTANDSITNEANPQNINFQDIHQLITNSVRNENKQEIKTVDQEIKQDIKYEAEVQRILQEHPEFVPEEKPPLDINISMTSNKPNYIVSKENGKVKVETQAFKELNAQIVGLMKLNKEILLEKQSETLKLVETAKIELEICSRMKTSIDKPLQSIYEAKIKDWQKKIKENELRLSTINNLLNGR